MAFTANARLIRDDLRHTLAFGVAYQAVAGFALVFPVGHLAFIPQSSSRKGQMMLDRRPPAFQPRRPTTMLRVIAPILLLLGLFLSAGAPTDAHAAAPRYFPETGHNVPEIFINYWNANGGLESFGLPLTEPYEQGGLTIQYFERARFERHPKHKDTPFEVLLGQLGREIRAAEPAVAPNAASGGRFFPETGHNVALFLRYWETNGGLARFGLPLTEERRELSVADGQPYTVQYFERARIEWHPEAKGTRYEFLLGQLGRERYDAVRRTDPVAAAAGTPTTPPVTAAAPMATDTIEMIMWRTINADRAKAGVPPLAYDPLVAKAAAIHVKDMIANNFLEHEGSDGSRPIDRQRRVGVIVQWASENISMECAKDPATAVRNIHAWMMAEPYAPGLYNHHWNLMYKGYSRVGIAFGIAKNGCWVMSQNFADGEPTPGSIK
jgi:uncharacterized protein YkwD